MPLMSTGFSHLIIKVFNIPLVYIQCTCMGCEIRGIKEYKELLYGSYQLVTHHQHYLFDCIVVGTQYSGDSDRGWRGSFRVVLSRRVRH